MWQSCEARAESLLLADLKIFGEALMEQKHHIRRKWLKFMYVYTIILPGLTGLTVIFWPELYLTAFQWQPQDQYLLGITGSMWLSFAILSAFALRNPLRFLPVLLFQLSYKVIWLSLVVAPLWFNEGLSIYEIVFALTMVSYVIGDLIAIPFSYLFQKETVQSVAS
jgi:hypothetical protein